MRIRNRLECGGTSKLNILPIITHYNVKFKGPIVSNKWERLNSLSGFKIDTKLFISFLQHCLKLKQKYGLSAINNSVFNGVTLVNLQHWDNIGVIIKCIESLIDYKGSYVFYHCIIDSKLQKQEEDEIISMDQKFEVYKNIKNTLFNHKFGNYFLYVNFDGQGVKIMISKEEDTSFFLGFHKVSYEFKSKMNKVKLNKIHKSN